MPKDISTCPVCGINCAKKYRWRPGPIVHCIGAPDVLSCSKQTVHHGRRTWRCPRCTRRLGCDYCCGINARNILCVPCLTYADGEVVAGSGLEPMVVFNLKDHNERNPAGIDRALPAADRE